MQTSSWQIELLRLSVFTSTTPIQENLGWWNSASGSKPESLVSKPAVGVFSATGLVMDVNFTLNLSLGRIDWLVAGVPSDSAPIPVIGDYRKAKDKFDSLLTSWVDRKPVPISRLALGVVARWPARDKVDAYKAIARFLSSIKIDAENSSELTYQINRPRKSTAVDDLGINRLSKWSVKTLNVTTVTGPAISTPLETFAHLEMDINTDVGNSQDLAGWSTKLLEEFFSLAEEIMEKGDVQ